MRGAPWQCNFESLMFISDFDSCAVLTVDLNHFNDPLKQLVGIREQSGVPDRTSEAHL